MGCYYKGYVQGHTELYLGNTLIWQAPRRCFRQDRSRGSVHVSGFLLRMQTLRRLCVDLLLAS